MINIEVATAVSPLLIVGEEANLYLDGSLKRWKIVDRTPFSVTFKAPTNNLTVPIEYTELYRKELAMRVPITATGEGVQKRPGRPKKATSEAPVEQPGPPLATGQGGVVAQPNQFLPPGYAGPFTPGLAGAEAAIAQQQAEATKSNMPPSQPTVQKPITEVQTVAIEQAQGVENWAEKAFEEALNDLGEAFAIILTGVKNEAAEAIAQNTAHRAATGPIKRLTCFECVFFDHASYMCSKFQIQPPLHIVATAVVNCKDFIEAGGEIGDDEIPF